jgi:hypothetical protein
MVHSLGAPIDGAGKNFLHFCNDLWFNISFVKVALCAVGLKGYSFPAGGLVSRRRALVFVVSAYSPTGRQPSRLLPDEDWSELILPRVAHRLVQLN